MFEQADIELMKRAEGLLSCLAGHPFDCAANDDAKKDQKLVCDCGLQGVIVDLRRRINQATTTQAAGTASLPASLQLSAEQVTRIRAAGVMKQVVAVAVTMLYDTHQDEVLRAFSFEQLTVMSEMTGILQEVPVEEIYKSAWELLDAPVLEEDKTI